MVFNVNKQRVLHILYRKSILNKYDQGFLVDIHQLIYSVKRPKVTRETRHPLTRLLSLGFFRSSVCQWRISSLWHRLVLSKQWTKFRTEMYKKVSQMNCICIFSIRLDLDLNLGFLLFTGKSWTTHPLSLSLRMCRQNSCLSSIFPKIIRWNNNPWYYVRATRW